MKRASLFVAIALLGSLWTAPASAQDVFGIDNYSGQNYLLDYSYAKQRANRLRKSEGRRKRGVRSTRRYRKSRYKNSRRTRSYGRSNYRSRSRSRR